MPNLAALAIIVSEISSLQTSVVGGSLRSMYPSQIAKISENLSNSISRKRSHIKKNPLICIVSYIRRISIPNFTAIGTIVFEIRLLQTHVPPQNLFVGPLYYNWHQAGGLTLKLNLRNFPGGPRRETTKLRGPPE